MADTILIRNDHDFRIKGFRDTRAAAGTYLNAATTATWAITTAKNGGGTAVSNGTMEYVTDSNGEYVGGVDDAVSLTEGTEYWLQIILIQGGVRGDWNIPFTAVRRTGKTPIS